MNRNDHHLIQQVLDGDVSRETFDVFQQRLREESELLKLYGDYALLQHTLIEEFEGGRAAGIHLMEPVRRNTAAPTAVAIAAVLALLAVVWFTRPWLDKSASADVALLTFSVDAVWRIEGPSRSIGGATGVGGESVLHLDYGRAGISLSPTVTALVEGPAELTFRSGEALFMKSGKGYFTVGGNGGGLTLETPRVKVANFGAEFGIEVPVAGAEEILVSAGEMRIVSQTGNGEVLLAAGDAAQISARGAFGCFPADGRRFAKALGRFRSVGSDFGSPRVLGNPANQEIRDGLLRLPEFLTGPDSSVLLTTLDLGSSFGGDVADDGRSFMSFFSKGSEVLQFGDPSGADASHADGDKQQTQVILPERPVDGLRNVTLRYDPRTGDVSLHEGGLPLGTVICAGKIPLGSSFDEIRLGASSGSVETLKAVDIRVGLE
jgi:hypothetical protein